jgi:hypothetical protein
MLKLQRIILLCVINGFAHYILTLKYSLNVVLILNQLRRYLVMKKYSGKSSILAKDGSKGFK